MSITLFEVAKEALNEALERHVREEEWPHLKPILDLVTGSMAPASTSLGRHGGFEGGLACHIGDVWSLARNMAGSVSNLMIGRKDAYPSVYDGKEISGQIISLGLDSVFKVCLLHDLNKVVSLNNDPYYINNILTNGQRSPQKPWKINEIAGSVESVRRNLQHSGFEDHPVVKLATGPSTQIREGQASLAVAFHLSPGLEPFISEDEAFAVIYHDGAFVSTRDGVMSRKSALQILLHAADMIASGFLC
jgi:hypothetical protein